MSLNNHIDGQFNGLLNFINIVILHDILSFASSMVEQLQSIESTLPSSNETNTTKGKILARV